MTIRVASGTTVAKWRGARVKNTPSGGTTYTLTIPNNTFTPITYNTNIVDTDGFHPITTNTNLTGTVSKTAGSTTITGSGTSFTTQLAVGYPVTIPGGSSNFNFEGTAADVVVVASITDDTHFTAYVAPVNSASGQTAHLDASVFVVPPGLAGYYQTVLLSDWAGSTANTFLESSIVPNNIPYNGGAPAEWEYAFLPSIGTGTETAFPVVGGPVYMAEGQFLQHMGYQLSGGDLLFRSDTPGTPMTFWRAGV